MTDIAEIAATARVHRGSWTDPECESVEVEIDCNCCLGDWDSDDFKALTQAVEREVGLPAGWAFQDGMTTPTGEVWTYVRVT